MFLGIFSPWMVVPLDIIHLLSGFVVILIQFFSLRVLFALKKNGEIETFFNAIAILVIIHVSTSLCLQVLNLATGIATYIVHIVIALILLRLAFRTYDHRKMRGLAKMRAHRFSMISIFLAYICLGMISWQFFSVKTEYRGPVQVSEYQVTEKEGTALTLVPQSVDEWLSAGAIKRVIQSKSLPPPVYLSEQGVFPNFLLVYFSVLTSFALLVGINPIFHFGILSILSGILIALAVYIVCRSIFISRAGSYVAALGTAYIVNSASMPAYWTLIPVVAGILLLLLSIASFSRKVYWPAYVFAVSSVLVYPPMLLFVVAGYGFAIIVSSHAGAIDIQRYKKVARWLLPLTVFILVVLSFAVWVDLPSTHNTKSAFDLIVNLIVRLIPGGAVPSLWPHVVFPFVYVLLIFLGLLTFLLDRKELFHHVHIFRNHLNNKSSRAIDFSPEDLEIKKSSTHIRGEKESKDTVIRGVSIILSCICFGLVLIGITVVTDYEFVIAFPRAVLIISTLSWFVPELVLMSLCAYWFDFWSLSKKPYSIRGGI